MVDAVTLDGSKLSLPDRGVFLGSFGALAHAELGIWRRLLAESQGDEFPVWTLHFGAWTSKARQNLAAATTPSLHPQTLLAPDSPDWRALIEPDRPERAFAFVKQGTIAPVLMVGAPTEEAWDLFRGTVEEMVTEIAEGRG